MFWGPFALWRHIYILQSLFGHLEGGLSIWFNKLQSAFFESYRELEIGCKLFLAHGETTDAYSLCSHGGVALVVGVNLLGA